nr:unnamed protein product [Digitaria exilis]
MNSSLENSLAARGGTISGPDLEVHGGGLALAKQGSLKGTTLPSPRPSTTKPSSSDPCTSAWWSSGEICVAVARSPAAWSGEVGVAGHGGQGGECVGVDAAEH